MPARTRQSSMVAVRHIRRGTALVPAHATAANVPTRGEPDQCDVRAPRSSPFLARSCLMRRHLIASASPGRGCGPWTVLPFVDACADRLDVLCELELRMPNPLFIVSHAHVNKKQRRIASIDAKIFHDVVRCDAFMPHDSDVADAAFTRSHADEGRAYPRRLGAMRRAVEDARTFVGMTWNAWPSHRAAFCIAGGPSLAMRCDSSRRSSSGFLCPPTQQKTAAASLPRRLFGSNPSSLQCRLSIGTNGTFSGPV